jgi:outer membrane receptor protein involved in Fe transport
MRFAKFFICAIGILAVALPAVAQVPTGTLTGHVDNGKEALPGVTVTVTSPSLQGARTATTSVNGDYIFTFLPPGDYNIRFELQGFQTVETGVKMSAAQRSTVNATMPQAKVAEEVTVTGSYDTISTSQQVASTVTQDMLNKLPVAQNFYAYAALASGTASTGPSGNLTMSGGQSWENLFMVNGVNIQDNIRNTPTQLYIEDAIQETTTQTAAISAEYGRFAGGVVNMLTKSGGNEMHGSVRLNLDSSKWSNKAPLQTGILNDTINRTWMATLGGFIFKDKLWYFMGYRNRNTSNSRQTYVTNIPYNATVDEKRYEGKLTFSITPNHRIIGSYLKVDQAQGGYAFNNPLDLASVYTRQLPTDLIAANYTGVITDNFFVEGQYSRKTFAFENSGSAYTDIIKGTLLLDLNLGSAYRWWSPTFCGVCGPEKRDNKEYLAKGSYFLSTATLGTHDLLVGYDSFDDQRSANNYQSGSSFRFYGTDVIVRNGVLYPQFLTSNSFLRWTPIFALTKGTNFWTNSAFANDKWRLNDHLSFNVGVRYDKNDGKDSDGKLVAKDTNWSPRLGITWDPKANGEWTVNVGYGKYVMAIANSVADSTAVGGQPGTIDFLYRGPEINPDKNAANLIDTATALQMVFDWFNSVGGTDLTKNPYVDGVDIPGATALIKNSLNSTNAVEYTIGATKRLGSRGMLRVDYVNRTFGDFYALQRDTTTGTVTTANGTFDKGYYINNDSVLDRKYYAVQMQASYRVFDRLSLGGNYTYSRTRGNVDGETASSGPVSSGIFNYPEYLRVSWYAPTGDLSIDQRHKARVWAVYDVISTKHNTLSVSLLQSYLSGTPYGAVGTVNLVNSGVAYVTNPGYKNPPTSQTYYFTNRDAFHTDNVTQTDISFNYAFKVPALGAQLEFFVIPAVTNVFNEKALQTPNASVYTSRNSGKNLVNFNPFTTTPVQCNFVSSDGTKCLDGTTGSGYDHTDIPKANWMVAPTFGKATAYTAYQTPRTFTLSVGVRF